MLEQTDPSVLSFIYDKDESNEIIYEEGDENNDVFSHGQRRMSEILKAKLQRSNSILEPEKINEQIDYLDDLVEEVDGENEEEYKDNEDDAGIISDSVRNTFRFFFILHELQKRVPFVNTYVCGFFNEPLFSMRDYGFTVTSVHLYMCQSSQFCSKCA